MKENKLRDLINCGQFSVSTRIWSTDPFFYEACGQSGNFDYVEFVAEYAPYDFKDLPNIVRACELNGMGSMIKLDFQNRARKCKFCKAQTSGNTGCIRIS